MIDSIYAFGLGLLAASWWTSIAWPIIWTLLKIVVVAIIYCVPYIWLLTELVA